MIKGYKDKEILAKKYEELGSLQKVADYFRVSKKLILNYMKRFDIQRNQRKPKQEKPKKIDTFHKGYTISWNGYKMIYLPIHPHCDGKGYIREHILVMEKYLGRYLTEDEIVHHIDENKLNNDINNLKLMTKYEHKCYHSSKPRKHVDLEKAKDLLLKGYTMPQVAKHFNMSESGLRKKLKANGIELNLKRGGARRKHFNDL